MEIMFDYTLYQDNGGYTHLFVRDFGGHQLHGVEPTLYYFIGDRSDIVKVLSEIMASPNNADLDDWTRWNDVDPNTALAEMQATEELHNGGAWLIAEGDIYA